MVNISPVGSSKFLLVPYKPQSLNSYNWHNYTFRLDPMNLGMPDKVTFLCKELAAQGTCVQIFTSVQSGVLNKITLVSKPFATHRT